MLENYKPDKYNVHTVKATFNKDGYTGHIAFKHGGNCKGASVLETALQFLNDCDENDISRLVENNCDLKLHCEDNECWFSLELHNADGDILGYDDIDTEDLLDLIVSAEIIACTAEEN